MPRQGIREVRPGHFLIKVTQRLAWAAEFLNIPSHPERAGDGGSKQRGKKEEKQETWGKRKRGGKKLKLKTDTRVLLPRPLAPLLPAEPISGGPAAFPPKWGGGKEAHSGVSSWGCQRPQSLPIPSGTQDPSVNKLEAERRRTARREAAPLTSGAGQQPVPGSAAQSARPRAAPPGSPAPPEGCFGSEATPHPGSPSLPPFSQGSRRLQLSSLLSCPATAPFGVQQSLSVNERSVRRTSWRG